MGKNKCKFGKQNTFFKTVLQYTNEGEFINEWGAMMDVQRALGINQSSITRVCKGERKTAGGYKWKYKN